LWTTPSHQTAARTSGQRRAALRRRWRRVFHVGGFDQNSFPRVGGASLARVGLPDDQPVPAVPNPRRSPPERAPASANPRTAATGRGRCRRRSSAGARRETVSKPLLRSAASCSALPEQAPALPYAASAPDRPRWLAIVMGGTGVASTTSERLLELGRSIILKIKKGCSVLFVQEVIDISGMAAYDSATSCEDAVRNCNAPRPVNGALVTG
jgi:hypothetical protein